MMVSTCGTLPGLYPPKQYPKATDATAGEWSPAECQDTESFSTVMQTTHMRFCPDEIIYTDGSRKEVPGIGIATGSGVYRKLNTAYLKLKVHPYRQGMVNTINRAELVGI